MKKIIAMITAIVMMAIGLVAPTNATKAEAAYFDNDGHVRFTMADAVYEAKWNYRHADTGMCAVITLYDHITVALDGGKIVRIGIGDGTVYADVIDWYLRDYFRLNDVEVLI